MSAWKLVASILYTKPDCIGSAHDCELSGCTAATSGFSRLDALGLAVCLGGHRSKATWQLTPLGILWCENRVKVMRGRDLNERKAYDRALKRYQRGLAPPPVAQCYHRRHRIVATWLSSLPSGIRIEPAPSTYILKEAA